jgi:hypothetical protein
MTVRRRIFSPNHGQRCLDRCPTFAPSYMGRKRILQMLSLHARQFFPLAALFARLGEALEGAAPRLLRPMYARANMGHPSRGAGLVVYSKTQH